jgi:fibronectin type 3 domain-containing protein
LGRRNDTIRKSPPLINSETIVPSTFNSTVANVWTKLSNYGFIGDDHFDNPSFEWPGGSGNHHLYKGSIWVAGKDPSNVIHCTAPDEEEITLTTDPADTIRLFHLGDPFFQNRPNVHPSLADSQVSAEDTYAEYTDLDPGRHVPGNSPLGIKIIERTYKWATTYNYDYIIFDYQIINIGLDSDGDYSTGEIPQALTEVYIGLRMDIDVSFLAGGEFWNDDMVDYDTLYNISYMYDGDDPDRPGDDIGEFGMSTGYGFTSLLNASGGTPYIYYPDPVSHTWWKIDDDPSSERWKFDLMSTPEYRQKTVDAYDYRYLQSTGPFSMQPNDTVNIVWVCGVGEGLNAAHYSVTRAKEIYDNQYLTQQNPQPYPPFDVKLLNYYPNQFLQWQKTPEPDVASFNIYANGSLLDNIFSDSTKYVLPTSLTTGTLYQFNVTTVWSNGLESDYSDTVDYVYGTPSLVTGINGVPQNSGAFLSWNANPESNITGYNIYRNDQFLINVTTLAFTDSGLTNGNYYSYQVTAVNNLGLESERSAEILIIPNIRINNGILLIDDYGVVDAQIKYFIDSYVGYGFNFTYWNIIQDGPPSLIELLNFTSVVWLCGESFTEELYDLAQVSNELRLYLDNGGNLWLSGSEVLWSLSQDYNIYQGDFEYDYLKVMNLDETSNNFRRAISVLPNIPNLESSFNLGWVDKINDPDSSILYETTTLYEFGNIDPAQPSPFQGKPCAVYFADTNFKTCLTAFPLYSMDGNRVSQLSRYVLNTIFGESYNSNPAPLPPPNFKISDWGETTIDLIWDLSNEQGILGYNQYVAIVDSGPYIKSNLELIQNTFYTVDSLTPGTEYFIKISSVDDTQQEGQLSDYVSEVAGKPHPVSNLLWTSITNDGVATIQWDSSSEPDIANYKIYVDSVFSFFTTDTMAQISTNYENKIVWVRAIDIMNLESDVSDTLSILYVPTTENLLVVNGISSIYGSELTNFYSSGACLGNHQAHIWDLFGDQGVDYTSLNSNFTQQFLTGGAIPDTFLFKYHKVIWIGNSYAGDLYSYSPKQVLRYIIQRGNFLLATRAGEDFFNNALEDYCGINSFVDWQSITNTYPLVSQDSNLVDIGSNTVAGAASFFRLDANPNTTVLFKWLGHFPFERIAGIRVQKPDKGEFIYIAGRPYRLDLTAQFQNYDYIIQNWLGGILDNIENKKQQIPRNFELFQNYPNPFNPVTTIKFGLPKKTEVTLTIYNILGQQIKKFEENYKAGYHEIQWNGLNHYNKQVASGVYIYKFEADKFTKTKKCIFLK